MAKVITLGTLRTTLENVRSAKHLLATGPRMNVRMLFAIVSLGRLRHRDEIGGWPAGVGAMSWRVPSAGRRSLLINAMEELFSFPTSTLLRHCDHLARKNGTGAAAQYVQAPDIPIVAALDPLTNLPPTPGSAEPCRIVFGDDASVKRWNVPIAFDSARWWWNADAPYERAYRVEHNPGNTINTQQGVECFYPVEGKTRAEVVADLAVPRPDCSKFSGSPGSGTCTIAPTAEMCMAADKNAVWPRVVLTNAKDTGEWGIAPDGFEALRVHVKSSTFGELRRDLAVIAGACKALREGQDFTNGTIVIDESWLRSQLSDDAWEALRS